MELPNETAFFSLFREVLAELGVEASSDEESRPAEEEASLVGTIQFSNEAGSKMLLQLEKEDFPSWEAVRVSIDFCFSLEDEVDLENPFLLQALLECRLLPGTAFPVASSLLPENQIQLQCVLSLNEKTKEQILSLISFASDFYQGILEAVRDVGLSEEFLTRLQAVDEAAATLWNEESWSHLKNEEAYAERAHETFSLEGHYYRWLPATEATPGMMAIHVGSFENLENRETIFPLLAKLNAVTFLGENYCLGLEAGKGMILMALQPPEAEEMGVSRVTYLLQRAADVKKIVMNIMTELESARLKEAFKGMKGITELVLD